MVNKNLIHNLSIKKDETRPILAVKRSSKHIYCDLVNSKNGKILDSASDLDLESGTKSERAEKVGEKIAEIAKTHKIKSVIFDRRGYKYHGRVRALAEAARKNGLEF